MTAPLAAPSLGDELELAWRAAGLTWDAVPSEAGRVILVTPNAVLRHAFHVTVNTLSAAGYRVCASRGAAAWSVYAFSEHGSVQLQLQNSRAAHAGVTSVLGRVAPCIALAGPDGVGKSTALKGVTEWFSETARFIDVHHRAWRPALLPPLGLFFGKGMGHTADQKPRRKPGNLQFLRLAYYFCDYLAGSWIKDRNRTNDSRLVLYDRCALDMTVDPYRFGLKSRRGTNWIYSLTPLPQTVILLYDDPKRIYERKRDLEEHEMAEQLRIWLQLAAHDHIHAVIRASAGAAEVAKCVRDLMVDAFVSRHEHDFPPPPASILAATRSILDAGSDGSDAEEYAVIPGIQDPRFLIPLKERKAAAAALGIYNAQRPLARVAKTMLRLALAAGVGRVLLRDRISISAGAVKHELSRVFGGARVQFAVSVGTAGPNQKPVLQILDDRGKELGYAKIGWNSRTIAAVRNEEYALRMLGRFQFDRVLLPSVMHAGWLGDRYLLVQTSCGMTRPAPTKLVRPLVNFLTDLHRIAPSWGDLPFPRPNEITELRQAGFHYYAHIIAHARERFGSFGTVPFGPLHGDFTPWNMRQRGEEISIFDWECFEQAAPAAWDLFHFLVAGRTEIEDARPGAVFAAIAGPAAANGLINEYLKAIGARDGAIVPLLASYAAYSLATSLAASGPNPGAKNRALRRTWASLLMLCCYSQPGC